MKSPAAPAHGAVLRQWLHAPGSLSRRLAALGKHFEVQTLCQGPASLQRHEAVDLGSLGHGRCWVREVLLRVDGEALVWARSAVPCVALRGPWRAVLGLGSRPLADLLFKEPRVSRSPLRRERLAHGGALRRRLARQWQGAQAERPPQGLLWARSSVFCKHGMPLRVMEVFSPRLAAVRLPRVAQHRHPSRR